MTNRTRRRIEKQADDTQSLRRSEFRKRRRRLFLETAIRAEELMKIIAQADSGGFMASYRCRRRFHVCLQGGRQADCATFRIPSLMSNRTIRIPDKGGRRNCNRERKFSSRYTRTDKRQMPNSIQRNEMTICLRITQRYSCNSRLKLMYWYKA